MIRTRSVVVRIFFFGALISALVACGGPDYGKTLDVLVPPTWTQVSASGKISGSCTSGADCGHLERTYQMNSNAQTGIANIDRQLQQHGCATARQGNGLVGTCNGGLRVAVSFTTDTASVVMTKTAKSQMSQTLRML